MQLKTIYIIYFNLILNDDKTIQKVFWSYENNRQETENLNDFLKFLLSFKSHIKLICFDAALKIRILFQELKKIKPKLVLGLTISEHERVIHATVRYPTSPLVFVDLIDLSNWNKNTTIYDYQNDYQCENWDELLMKIYTNILTLQDEIKKTFFLPNVKFHSRSLASFSAEVLRWTTTKKFFDFVRPYVNQEYYQLQKASAIGGYVAANKNHDVWVSNKQNIINIDISSSYPAIAFKGLPYEFLEKKPRAKNYFEYYILVKNDLKLHPKYDILDNKLDNVDYFIFEDKQCWICPKTAYDEICKWVTNPPKIKKKIYSKQTNKASVFFHKLFYLRNTISKELKNDVKYMLNMACGKFSQKHNFNKFVLNDNDILEPTEQKLQFRSLLIGVHIYWHGRAILWQKIRELIDKNYTILYCDTDSVIFVTDDNYTSNVGNKKMGEFSEVGRFDYFSKINCKYKTYLLINHKTNETKLAHAGLSNSILNQCKFNLEELKTLFHPNNNVVFKLKDFYFNFNSTIKPTHVVNSDFKLTKI